MFKHVRIFAGLAAILMLTTANGCTNTTKYPSEVTPLHTNKKQANETTPPGPVTLKVMVKNGIAWVNGIQEDSVAKEIEKKTGVTVDWINLMNVSDVPNYLRTLLASGDLPDIMPQSDLGMKEYFDADVIAPIDEYLENHGKNILKNADKLIKLNRMNSKDGDGKLYFLSTGYNDRGINYDSIQQVPHIRYDLYKAIGAPKISTDDELLSAIKLMVDKYPKADDGKKAYGMGLWFGDNWSWVMIERVHFASEGWQTIDGISFFNKNTGYDKKYQFLFNTEDPRYKGLKFFNKAWNMGLLDPDTAVLKFVQYQEKATAGRYYYGTDYWSTKDFYNPTAYKNGQKKGFEPMYNFVGDTKKISVFQMRDAGDDKYFVTKMCKTPERAVDLLDFLYSEEGVRLLYNGIEGQHYEIVDGKPKLTTTYSDQKSKDLSATVISTGVGKYSLVGLGKTVEDLTYPGRVVDYSIDPEEGVKGYTSIDKEYCSDMGITTITEKFLLHPDPYYSNLLAFSLPNMPEEIQKIKNDVTQMLSIECFKVISAKNFDQAIGKMKIKALDLGYQKFTDWTFKAFDETKSKLGVSNQ
jgi:putative aldouronate transport system substrate-binding protein